MPTLGLLAGLAGCGNDLTSPVGRDLDALCAGRPTELPVRLVVTSVTSLAVAVGDTLTGTLRFAPEQPAGGDPASCAVAGSVRLATTASILAWVRDSTTPGFQRTGASERPAIAVVGTGEGHVFVAVLPVRDSVGTWEYFLPAQSAGVSGSIHHPAASLR